MKKSLFLTAAVTLALLSGCSKEYDGPDMEGVKLTVTGTVDEITTRVTDTSFDSGTDKIGITGGDYTNLEYTAGDNNTFSGEAIMANEGTTFTAYYPFMGTSGTSAGTQNISVVGEGNAMKSSTEVDYMFASATSTATGIAFTFQRKMSRLAFKFDKGTSSVTEDAEITSYTLKNVVVAGTFNTVDGTLTPDEQTGQVVVSGAKVDGNASYVIVPAQAAATIEIEIVIGTDTYVGEFTTAQLEASHQYTYTITLGEAAPSVQIECSGTISEWTEGTGGTIAADKQNILEIGDFVMADGSILDKGTQLTDEQKTNVRGVVYFVGNPFPSVLYSETEEYGATNDVFYKDYQNTIFSGLAMGKEAETASAFCATELNTEGLGAMTVWYKNESNLAAIYPSRYTWGESSFATSGTFSDADSKFFGYNNTYLWKKYDEAKTTLTIDALTALSTYAQATENQLPTNASSWYIPSEGELVTLTEEAINTLKSSLSQWSGKEAANLLQGDYWSSTEGKISNDKAQTMSVRWYSKGAFSSGKNPRDNNNAATYKHIFSFAFCEPTE